ncbi:MAG: hypothetical protein ABIN61_06775 [candidate division WOR-3 bacterium]
MSRKGEIEMAKEMEYRLKIGRDLSKIRVLDYLPLSKSGYYRLINRK